MNSHLSRRRFLEGSAALLGVSLIGCGRGQNLQPTAESNPDGTITLTGLGEIQPGTAASFNFPSGDPGLFFVTSSGKEGAVSAICTHLGCTVEWNAGAEEKAPLRCPCHDSYFALDGAVLSGPAKTSLTRYRVSRSDDAVVLKRV